MEGKVPFFEPGLQELIVQNIKKGRLQFISDGKKAVDFGEVIFNCVNTPPLEDGSADLRYVLAVAKTIGENIKEYKIIVNKSTVPPGTARKTVEIIRQHCNNIERPNLPSLRLLPCLPPLPP